MSPLILGLLDPLRFLTEPLRQTGQFRRKAIKAGTKEAWLWFGGELGDIWECVETFCALVQIGTAI